MKKFKITKETVIVIFLLLFSAILNLANIQKEGFGNQYYAAGVRSMSMSLKNFFFVSYDPSGFISIDKPPIGFWIQTLSVKLFGYHGWAILLPQALAGVISVFLVYYLVKRVFGMKAGFLSALCLSITPVFVAASRNNTIDNLLVMTLLLSCYALSLSAEKGQPKYLYFSLILVGVGFNIKMLEAYMILPAIYITYLLSSRISYKKKLLHLFSGTILLLAVSLSWALLVDFTNTQVRPYVGGSRDNSVIQLILGHNGSDRLGFSDISLGEVTKLFARNSMADQIVWFLPVSLLGFLACSIKEKLRLKLDNQRKIAIVLWFTWLLPEIFYFSFSNGLFHFYYLTMLAPPIAALTGIGITTMWQLYQEGKWNAWFLPIAFLVEGLIHSYILSNYQNNLPNHIRYIILIAILFCFITVFLLSGSNLMFYIKRRNYLGFNRFMSRNTKRMITLFGIVSILVTPFIGASATIYSKVSSAFPCAGLEIISSNETLTKNESLKERGNYLTKNNSDNNDTNNNNLINYLTNNHKDEKYIVAVASSQSSQNIIVKSGQPVLTIGGYAGADPSMTLSDFKHMVKNGEVRYVLTGGKSSGVAREIMMWVMTHGKLVPKKDYMDDLVNNEDSNQSFYQNIQTKNILNSKKISKEMKLVSMFEELNMYDLKGVKIS